MIDRVIADLAPVGEPVEATAGPLGCVADHGVVTQRAFIATIKTAAACIAGQQYRLLSAGAAVTLSAG